MAMANLDAFWDPGADCLRFFDIASQYTATAGKNAIHTRLSTNVGLELVIAVIGTVLLCDYLYSLTAA